MTNQAPGNATAKCARISYTGSLAASVKLYVSSGITNGTFYNLKVERGWGMTTLDGTMSCAGFASSSTPYDGALKHSSHDLRRRRRRQSCRGGLGPNDTVDYRFTITQNDDPTANAHTSVTTSGAHLHVGSTEQLAAKQHLE